MTKLASKVALTLGLAALLAPSAAAQNVRVERINYTSDGLRVGALVCRPDTRAGRPLLNLVHGGFESAADRGRCEEFARMGFVVAASDLRGQNGSQGTPEVCAGEVNDTLALRRLVQTRYNTNPNRVAYLGVSSGGCIAVRAAGRDPSTTAAVNVVGPTDIAEVVRLLRAGGSPAYNNWIRMIGGTPEARPDLYRVRNALPDAVRLRAPLLVAFSGNDPLAPLSQACQMMRARLQSGIPHQIFRVSDTGQPVRQTPAQAQACSPTPPVGGITPASLRGRDTLYVVDGLGHSSNPSMWVVARAFLQQNVLQ